MSLGFIKIKNIFPVIFLIVLIIDIIIKITHEVCVHRFISKISLSVLLISYYIFSQKEAIKIKRLFMILALMFFLIGDIFFILYEVELYYIFGIFSFAIGKLFYVFRFSNQEDFRLRKLLPIIIFCFSLMMVMFQLIYDNLNNYFFPALIYLFADAMFVIFAFLRKNLVNNRSFYLVFIGVLLSLFADSIAALSSFYSSTIPFQEIGVMLFYGMSQLLIVLGVLGENDFDNNQTVVVE